MGGGKSKLKKGDKMFVNERKFLESLNKKISFIQFGNIKEGEELSSSFSSFSQALNVDVTNFTTQLLCNYFIEKTKLKLAGTLLTTDFQFSQLNNEDEQELHNIFDETSLVIWIVNPMKPLNGNEFTQILRKYCNNSEEILILLSLKDSKNEESLNSIEEEVEKVLEKLSCHSSLILRFDPQNFSSLISNMKNALDNSNNADSV